MHSSFIKIEFNQSTAWSSILYNSKPLFFNCSPHHETLSQTVVDLIHDLCACHADWHAALTKNLKQRLCSPDALHLANNLLENKSFPKVTDQETNAQMVREPGNLSSSLNKLTEGVFPALAVLAGVDTGLKIGTRITYTCPSSPDPAKISTGQVTNKTGFVLGASSTSVRVRLISKKGNTTGVNHNFGLFFAGSLGHG